MRQRILTAPVDGLQRIDKIRKVLVLVEKIEIASNGLFDVILEHGDDQLVLALEIRIERAPRKAGRGRNGLDAGAADSLILEDARRRFEQLFAGIVPGRDILGHNATRYNSVSGQNVGITRR
jgi:hypothetical protein